VAVTTPAPHRRAVPKQARAAATYAKLLDAAVIVLVERGLQGFNTNVVAEAAGVNVATLYHYFPDKNAILRELFDRNERARVDYVVQHLGLLPTATDLRVWVSELVQHVLTARLSEPAGAVLRRAWRAVPELTAVEEERNDSLVVAVAQALQARYPQHTEPRLQTTARVLLTASIAVLDQAIEQPDRTQSLADELVEVIHARLAVFEP
jgi:AcrR family transcriptional regulator